MLQHAQQQTTSNILSTHNKSKPHKRVKIPETFLCGLEKVSTEQFGYPLSSNNNNSELLKSYQLTAFLNSLNFNQNGYNKRQ